jgi:hypothetical protein
MEFFMEVLDAAADPVPSYVLVVLYIIEIPARVHRAAD